MRISEPRKGIGDSTELCPMDWDEFQALYGTLITRQGKPNACAVRPHDKALVLYPAADKNYPIYYEYIRSAQQLKKDADVPIMPEDFHMLIVYDALLDYAFYEPAPEAAQEGKRKQKRLMNRLMRAELPGITVGGI